MKNIFIKIPIWLWMVWPYVFFLGMLFPENSFLGVYCALTIILCVLNIVNACSYKGNNTARELALWGMVTKLVHMPFNVVVFLLSILIFGSMASTSEAIVAPFVILFLIICDFLFMITSSAYCAKGAFAATEQSIMTKENATMLSICSFIIISDIICAVIIYSKIKKNKKVKKV